MLDRATNEWRDGETRFLRCTAWRELAENAAASLGKGTRVIATGRLRQRNYQDRDGVQRTAVELELDDIGASLRRARFEVVGVARTPSSDSETPF